MSPCGQGARRGTDTSTQPARQDVRTPCSAHRAVQPRGVTWTTMRRRHCRQYRGGSSDWAALHREWSPRESGSPQRSQKSSLTMRNVRPMTVPTGLEATITHTVAAEDTAKAFGSGDVDVLATPRLLALAEAATIAALFGSLSGRQTTVGTRVQLEHLRASPVGAEITVHARLGYVDGRLLRFDVAAEHADGQVVASGQVTRVLVERDRFLARTAG